MSESRLNNSLRNTFFTFLFKISDVVFAFVLRTIFIHTLGMSYLGIGGLFNNILIVLALMELGVGSSIVFSLYKPLAEKDYGKVAALMQLYKKAYTVIGIAILVVGFSLTPFLKYIINLPDNVDHLYIIYWISVGNTAISYFLAYRRSLLIADQRTDINSKNQILFRTTRFVLLTVALLVTRNYIVYLVADLLNTFASNVQINMLVKKRYKIVETAQISELSKIEKRNIVKFMTSGILFKFGQTVVNSTDSIIISAFINTILVGIYSNYYMITSSIQVFISMLFGNITASVGNFAVEKSGKESEVLFKKVNFINFGIAYYFTICIFALINPFVEIWVGNDKLLSASVIVVLAANFYISTLQFGAESFLGAVGKMYYHNRFRSLIEGVVNLIVSIALVKWTPLGITGVFLGTTVCFLCGRVWMDAYTLYKHWFKVPFKRYVIRYIAYFVLTAVMSAIAYFISNLIIKAMGINIISWMLSGIGISIVGIGVFILIFRKSAEYKYCMDIVRSKLKR